MKRYLIALSITYGLTGCNYEDGKDGSNGLNGKDGESCKIVEQGNLQCGEDVIPIRGEKGEKGESCEIVTDQGGDILVCGEDSVRLPTNNDEQSACASEKIANGNFVVTCNGESFEIPGSGSIADIVKLAMTPVKLIETTIDVNGNQIAAQLKFNVPINIEVTHLDNNGPTLSQNGPNIVQIQSSLGKNSHKDWTLSIPKGVFTNSYYKKSTLSEDVTLQISEYSYTVNLETILFTSNAYTICDPTFALINLKAAKNLEKNKNPVLLNLIARKAFDPKSKKVVTADPSDHVDVYCVR